MTWMCFQQYWPFVRGLNQRTVDSVHDGPVTQIFDVFFLAALIKLLNKLFSFQHQ